MNRFLISVLQLAIVAFAVSSADSSEPTAQDTNASQIQPYTENAFYWQYHGKPVLLLGGSDDDNLFQWTGKTLTDQLDLLKSVGGNFVRNTMSDRNEGGYWGPAPDGVQMVYAFKKVGDRYDLNQWNDEYWKRFDNFLKETHRRQIFVQIELWDGWDFTDFVTNEIPKPLPATWSVHPWNPQMNSNYTAENSGIPTVWRGNGSASDVPNPFFLTMPGMANDSAMVRTYQEAFVAKVLKHSLPYDHVLYAIQNESEVPHAWGDHWADFIHKTAAAKGKRVYVTEMWGERKHLDDDHRYIIDHPKQYDFFESSQNTHNKGQRGWDQLQMIRNELLAKGPRPINNVKSYVKWGPSWNWSGGWKGRLKADGKEASDMMWRGIFGGCAGFRFHRGPDYYGHGLNAIAQKQINNVRMLTDAMNVFACEPHNDLLSDRDRNEAYCLANPGQEYAVYFVNGGSVELDLSAADESLEMKWLDIAGTKWQETQTIKAAQRVKLTPPGKGQWAVVVK